MVSGAFDELAKRRFSILATLAIAAAGAALAPASAGASSSPVAVLEGCRERALVVPGVERLVRQGVPAEFELVRDPFGRPLLAVVGSRCESYSIPGETKSRPTTFTFFVAIIESPGRTGCLSQLPVIGNLKPDLLPLCNFYNFFAAYNNRALVREYRKGFRAAGVDAFPLHYVRRLAFRAGSFDVAKLGTPWHFRAGGRTPSRFKLDAVVREGPVRGPMTYSFWFPGSSGIVGGSFDVADFAPGEMDATLLAAPRSEMAALFGSANPEPLIGLANRYDHAEGRLLDANP